MTSKRTKPPVNRTGVTTKYSIGDCTLYLTVNLHDGRPVELLAKADEGHQGQADVLCIVCSLALQHGCPAETLARHLRGHRYAPEGYIGQPTSIADAIYRTLEGLNKEMI